MIASKNGILYCVRLLTKYGGNNNGNNMVVSYIVFTSVKADGYINKST